MLGNLICFISIPKCVHVLILSRSNCLN
uniref:Uncharacterized protein n=1 Tax=Arundo donax TaxID=35708 RepID=A0A0A9FZC6_ARUDO